MGGFTRPTLVFGGEAALSVEARYLEPDLPEELQQTYTQTFDRLRRMFRARGCTPEESADLAQEAAVRAFVHIRRWGVNGSGLDPLLNRIARNLLIDRYRRTTPHIVPLDDAGELHDPEQDPTEEVARRQRSHAVHAAIRGLPARHKAAITYSLNGLTPEEVGRRLGIGRNAADALLHRARRSLKERLETVGEGMFGVALGFRVRWDRIVRRVTGGAIDAHGADMGMVAASSVGVSLATAAVLAVIGIGGAAGGPPTFGGRNAQAAAIGAKVAAASAAAPAASAGSASVGGPSAPSGSGGGGNSYHLGPTTTTWGSKGIDSDTTVPGPKGKSGEPLLNGTGYLHRKGTHEPSKGDPGVLIARAICESAPILCEQAVAYRP